MVHKTNKFLNNLRNFYNSYIDYVWKLFIMYIYTYLLNPFWSRIEFFFFNLLNYNYYSYTFFSLILRSFLFIYKFFFFQFFKNVFERNLSFYNDYMKKCENFYLVIRRKVYIMNIDLYLKRRDIFSISQWHYRVSESLYFRIILFFGFFWIYLWFKYLTWHSIYIYVTYLCILYYFYSLFFLIECWDGLFFREKKYLNSDGLFKRFVVNAMNFHFFLIFLSDVIVLIILFIFVFPYMSINKFLFIFFLYFFFDLLGMYWGLYFFHFIILIIIFFFTFFTLHFKNKFLFFYRLHFVHLRIVKFLSLYYPTFIFGNKTLFNALLVWLFFVLLLKKIKNFSSLKKVNKFYQKNKDFYDTFFLFIFVFIIFIILYIYFFFFFYFIIDVLK